MQHIIVRAMNKVEPSMWKLDSPVLSLEDEEHDFEFDAEKQWKLVEMLENGDAWHVFRMLGEKKIACPEKCGSKTYVRDKTSEDVWQIMDVRRMGLDEMGGRMRSKDMKGDGRRGFLDGEKMRISYIKE